VSLLAEVLLGEVLSAEVLLVAEVETVLVVSELLVKKGMIPLESVTLGEEEALLFSDASLVTWYSWDLSRCLAGLGGIGSRFGTSGLCRFACLLI